jgi:hypothetical protein
MISAMALKCDFWSPLAYGSGYGSAPRPKTKEKYLRKREYGWFHVATVLPETISTSAVLVVSNQIRRKNNRNHLSAEGCDYISE